MARFLRLGGSLVGYLRAGCWRTLRALLVSKAGLLPRAAAAAMAASPLDVLLVRSLEQPVDTYDEERRHAAQVPA